MDFLDYIKQSNTLKLHKAKKFNKSLSIGLVTNFSDEILQKLLIGMSLSRGIYPNVAAVPYKQYHLVLSDGGGAILKNKLDALFFFFDFFSTQSEFSSKAHGDKIINSIENVASRNNVPIILSLFILPYSSPYTNLHEANPNFNLVKHYNERLMKIKKKYQNVHIFDTNKIMHLLGESNARNRQTLYAFDIPFSNQFFLELASNWFSYLDALLGLSKKCIVVDLDNTLWGGVLGEVGPHEIKIGPDYPGNAHLDFQRLLLEFFNRGIILAINSRNNLKDIEEVFRVNKNMILNMSHFASIEAHWGDKAEAMKRISADLGIGLQSMVFLDDDPLNRDIVRHAHPEVFVPDFSVAPEEFTRVLLSRPVFSILNLTDEDLKKGKMYTDERKRKASKSKSRNIHDYVASLNIKILISENGSNFFSRNAQLHAKTNQFNLTGKRFREDELIAVQKNGGYVFSAQVVDKFGDYGTVLAGTITVSGGVATLESFVMSCRVMGRGVEFRFLDYIWSKVKKNGVSKIRGHYLPSGKNQPAKDFLSDSGMTQQKSGSKKRTKKQPIYYSMNLEKYRPSKKVNSAISIKNDNE